MCGRPVPQLSNDRQRPRRRGDDSAGGPFAHAEQHVVPTLLGITALDEFIPPKKFPACPTQRLGVFRREQQRFATVRPGQRLLGRLVKRPTIRRADIQEARWPLDGVLPHIKRRVRHDSQHLWRIGRGYQRCRPQQHSCDALDGRARLAPAAACEDQPDEPIARRQLLIVSSPKVPVVRQKRPLCRVQAGIELSPDRLVLRCDPACF
jgi:hypothetical protein